MRCHQSRLRRHLGGRPQARGQQPEGLPLRQADHIEDRQNSRWIAESLRLLTDIQTAILYDHFTPLTLIQLAELGFCGWGVAEGVRQLRGTSVNPVPEVEHVLVTAGTGVPTSGLILG